MGAPIEESRDQVQARAHLRRGVRPVRVPKWLAEGECRVPTLPLFELAQPLRDDQEAVSEIGPSTTGHLSDQQ